MSCSTLPDPDIVVVAVPPHYAVPDVAARSLALYPDATVTDVASVKAAPLARLRGLTSDTARFVGGHPMAGRKCPALVVPGGPIRRSTVGDHGQRWC